MSPDEAGLFAALEASIDADCARRKVGAAIVAPDGSLLGTGRNGLAPGKPGCLTAGACPRGRLNYAEQPADVGYEATSCRSVHAEVAAIILVGRDGCIGSTLYITDRPCFHCSVVIEGAGLARVMWPTGSYDLDVWSGR